MERTYWLGRNRAAMAMAREAATAECRLIHFELAGRYSIKAAQCPPFMLPRAGPASGGEGAALHLPVPGSPSVPPSRPARGSHARQDPDDTPGDGR